MTIQKSTWNRYIDVLAAIDRTAAKKFTAYLNTHDISSQARRKAAIDYAAALADKYGESAAAMACEMYDAAAAASGAILPAAEPAATATYGEVAKTVNGMAKQNAGNDAMGSAIGRMVKRTGVDTTMKNAIRDGAQWAWIPSGDSCAFCLTLASRGWQRASKKALKNGHAEHIHSNCDCTYAVRFDSRSTVAGYDPDALYRQYQSAEGNTPQEKINSMRRELYAENVNKIRAQKRAAYEKNVTIYGGIPKSWQKNLSDSDDVILKGTNPSYKKDMPMYLTGTKDDYKHNCTNCVVAYSMRKRGYAVSAKSVGECGTLRNGDNLFTAWKGGKPILTTGSGLDDIIKYLNGCDEGAILAIKVDMPESIFNPMQGHAFVAEKRGTDILFIDPQAGKRYNRPEDVFDNVQTGKTKFMRIDNLEISDRGISACKEV